MTLTIGLLLAVVSPAMVSRTSDAGRRWAALGDHAAVAQHADRVAEPEDLLQLGGDEQHRHAVVGESDDELLDLGLGADVDAAGRLVEDQQLGLGDQPAGQQHLLLVAAAEVAHELRRGRRAGCRAP